MASQIEHVRNAVASDDRGAALVEYGLLISLIAIVAVVGVAVFGAGVNGVFDTIVNAVLAVVGG